ncbi:regulating synaptic membrane exocytosis protein 1-like isoform X2 [Alosa sapidissima]|uniref:regulating synaptic membrane exocytosis protein 1-like isoform X2 n=1 Tax=Alosa sapidissima TaxID=34773 RepID=UPI001C09A753|nr:regulating synaptic membrane exocytosis protein 1-like isoform X2 [Alosa sapidissima]
MSASVGPRGGPRPPTRQPSMPEMPDLSHLTEEERKIIMAVLVRQKEEEEKEEAMLKEEKPVQVKQVNLVGQKKPPQQNDISLHQQFSSYKEQVRRQVSVETRQQSGQAKDDAPTCGICHKTKFADGCGNVCSYCQTKFCARCGGRVSLRANNDDKVVIWVCNQCRKQQDILTKSGEWLPGQGPKQGGLGSAVSDPAMCGDPAGGQKKVRSRSQAPLGSSTSTAHNSQQQQQQLGTATGDMSSTRSLSEPPRDRKKPPSGLEQEDKAGGHAERRRCLAKIHSQGSEEREAGGRRESRRLSRGRSQECEVTGSGEGQRRTERPRPLSGDYHGDRNPPRHPRRQAPAGRTAAQGPPRCFEQGPRGAGGAWRRPWG